MDMVFILETGISCYRYGPNLRARTYFVEKDPRLYPDKWTKKELRDYRREFLRGKDKNHTSFGWFYYDALWEHISKAREEGKSLFVIDYSWAIAQTLDDFIRGIHWVNGPKIPKDPREVWKVFSFFHSDEDMGSLQFASTEEELVQDKIYYLEQMVKRFPFIKTVEIEYNKTLHQDYLMELFAGA